MTLAPGHTGKVTRTVTEALSAHTLGNSGVHVLATPCLAGICDKAAAEACADVATRRVRVDIRHLAATPVGEDVEVQAEIIEVLDNRVICSVTGRDSTAEIVTGTVERVRLDA